VAPAGRRGLCRFLAVEQERSLLQAGSELVLVHCGFLLGFGFPRRRLGLSCASSLIFRQLAWPTLGVLLKYAKAAGVIVDDLIDDDVKLSLSVGSRKKEKKN
jgi:hypothetical protein